MCATVDERGQWRYISDMTNIRDEQPEPLTVPLSTNGRETLTFDIGGLSGWAAYHSDITQQRDAIVLLRFSAVSKDPDAPIEIQELRVAAQGGAFSSPMLRTIPLSRITAAVNRPAVLTDIRPLLPTATNMVQAGRTPGSRMWAYILPPRTPVKLRPPKLKIKDPGGRRKPDEFYRRVADIYLAQATISDRAAKDIAEANSHPSATTVHRWLKEARSRGLLKLPGQVNTQLAMTKEGTDHE
jgi:hypothetical protein